MHETSKTIVQVYKPAGAWANSPPGVGDFIRGACHLHELATRAGHSFKIDISETKEPDDVIVDNAQLFNSGPTREVTGAKEFFKHTDHVRLLKTLDEFFNSNRQTIFVCTNMGHGAARAFRTARRISSSPSFASPNRSSRKASH